MQDHEVHRLAQIQMDFHYIDSSSAGYLVLRDPVLLPTCKITYISETAILNFNPPHIVFPQYFVI